MVKVEEIAGVRELWRKSTGLPEICVAVVDGLVDLDHPVFHGAQLSCLDNVWQDLSSGTSVGHGTHVASLIFGQPGGPVPGIAPGCSGINVPAFSDVTRRSSQLEIARGIELAVEHGAHIVNISGGQFSQSGDPEDALGRALRLCGEENILVVAAVGNNGCFCNHVPAAVSTVLAVGALGDDGLPLPQSNWGAAYKGHAILAPGQNLLGAEPGGGLVQMTGSSMAAPVVSGVAAVLLSMQVAAGHKPDPLGVGALLISTADKCDIGEAGHKPDGSGYCDRFLSGAINIERSTRIMSEMLRNGEGAEASACGCKKRAESGDPELGVSVAAEVAAAEQSVVPEAALVVQSAQETAASEQSKPPQQANAPQSGPLAMIDGPILSSLPGGMRQRVYALGELGYDFGTEARRDTFKQLMAPQEIDGTVLPPNPYDARQMVDHLANNPSEARSLIWTLNLELTPIYALEASGSFAAEIYGLLTRLLTGSVAADDDPAHIERVAIPGVLSGRSVKLYSGQVVPIVEIEQIRGLYGWEVNKLVEAAVSAAQAHGDGAAEVATITENLREFLTKIYYDLRNLGTMSRDRALNFAATNAFQAAQTFASALSRGMAVDTINVEKSPFCRLDSDCWDVQLRFFDPENSRRARRVYRFTIDVSDTMPVTLGEVRTWTAPQ
ncbi:hypothetical protein A6W98_03965 [Rhodovulum sulfidophilum DSM 1374]|uniref:PatA/PatG family cyanobactin maturation protease n=1 Tax=Rhodovulum sulfidophilum TaxID=35806 RepID=UPI0007B55BFC|nr:PatA/PatG family cyanobactin maturation protease [Rhodovulum sulfidophilum]ANB33300.1 hypothetical protein A6W98_03965 [Rhodovulum sulfidophilum DSM 1374]